MASDQRLDPVGENQHDLAEQQDDIQGPGNAVEVHGILGLASDHVHGALVALVSVLLVTVDERVVEQQRQHDVEHHVQHVRIPGVPSVLEHDHHVIVEAQHLHQLHREQRARVQHENRSHLVHRHRRNRPTVSWSGRVVRGVDDVPQQNGNPGESERLARVIVLRPAESRETESKRCVRFNRRVLYSFNYLIFINYCATDWTTVNRGKT